MGIDVMLEEDELSFRDEFRSFLGDLDLSFIELMDDEAAKEFPREFVTTLGENGYLGLPLPTDAGGRGETMVTTILAQQEVGALAFPLGCAMGMPTYTGSALVRYGDPDLVERYVEPTLAGDLVTAEAITEPLHGSDVVRLETSASREGDTYTITGEKRFQKGGVGADWFLTFARTDPSVPPKEGISAFVVERDHGIEVEEQFELMGWMGMGASRLSMRGVEIPVENRVGEEGEGLKIMLSLLQQERIMEATAALGTAREALKIAVKYSDTREQFERPIREFQGVNFEIADMATRLEAAQLLCLRAARRVDRERTRPNKEVSMAKLFATEAAWEITDQALQILGGIGYSDHYPLERFLRDVRVSRIYTGTNEIQRRTVQEYVYDEYLDAPGSAAWELWDGTRQLER